MMKSIISRKSLYSLMILVLLFAFLQTSAQQAKYVFFFIGDGMGLSHVAATEAYLAASKGENGFEKLSFTKFPVTGLATTYAYDKLITGSAAAGTALATGQKTTIGTIGMDASKKLPLKSIAVKAKENGMKVGIISSVSINHATPACFYAHQPERNMYYEIALELPMSGFDFFGGGGFSDPMGGEANQLSAYENAKQKGYTITSTREEFYALKPGDEKILARGNILEPSGAMRYDIDQTDEDITLPDFVEKAIEVLDNKKGFFIMCEEGKIDWAAHENDGVTLIHNVISLSESVDKAMDFYRQHPSETLIVVTADHETGGFALGHALTKYSSNFQLLDSQKISAQAFTLLADSLFLIENNQNLDFALQLVEAYFGLGGNSGVELSEYEENLLEEAYLVSVDEIDMNKDEKYIRYNGYYPLAATATHILNNKAGIAFTTWSHTCTPVPVFAIGAGAEQFNGYYDNTDIPKKIAHAMNIK